VAFAAAQCSTIENVRVNAEGAFAGFRGVPGRDAGAANIEVIGGKIGLLLEGSMAGPVVVGARLAGQTEASIVYLDFVPLALVGFHIIKRHGPVITTRRVGWSTSVGTMSLVDGVVELQDGGFVFDNSAGLNLYMRNVYVRGFKEADTERETPCGVRFRRLGASTASNVREATPPSSSETATTLRFTAQVPCAGRFSAGSEVTFRSMVTATAYC